MDRKLRGFLYEHFQIQIHGKGLFFYDYLSYYYSNSLDWYYSKVYQIKKNEEKKKKIISKGPFRALVFMFLSGFFLPHKEYPDAKKQHDRRG